MANILVFAASNRTGSFNALLASAVARQLEADGAPVTHIHLRDYEMPLYDGDLEAREGLPQATERLHELFRTHAGVFIASPEYNASMTPLLVNTIAWISRVQDHGGMAAAFGKPVFAIGSASPGALGGYRGLMALRQSLELQLQARVLPAMVSVPSAHQAFDERGELTNERTRQMLQRVVGNLLAVS